jgi:hypothetical protein
MRRPGMNIQLLDCRAVVGEKRAESRKTVWAEGLNQPRREASREYVLFRRRVYWCQCTGGLLLFNAPCDGV